MNARDFLPHDRLYVSNHAYSHGHVNNIADQLSRAHSVALPDWFALSRSLQMKKGSNLSKQYQNMTADWIITKFSRDTHLIEQAERIVRSNYSGKQQLFRKGRKVGSKNAASDGLEDVLGDVSSEATHAATEAQTATSDEISGRTVEAYAARATDDVALVEMLKQYALKKELHDVAGSITNALKNYCETNFAAGNARVDALIRTVNDIVEHRPTVVTLERRDLSAINLGTQHKHMPRLLKMCNAALRGGSHLNVWVYGPAGTGKSTAAEVVAKALGLDFYTNGKLATEYAVLGFINTTGYQTTQFRKAFENGGIYLADEIDGSMPDALLALNGALANGHCVFPDKVVKRHPNFIFIAAANTTGTGATIDYVGRFKQDAAFNDRFCFLEWPLDEGLEDSLVADKVWLARVRQVRAAIARVGIKGHLITPRAAIYGEALLAAGLTQQEVEESVLKKGLSAPQWSQVK